MSQRKHGLLDDHPEARDQEIYDSIAPREKSSFLSTIILIGILILCVFGFCYGMYNVLH